MDFAAARVTMVHSQLRANGVQDPAVLAAMADIPRESFLPKPLHGQAYVDEDLDLGGGRWLMEPLILARLLQALAVQPTDVALVAGDATGYATAIAARLASYVVSLDADPDTAQRAAPVLNQLSIGNVEFVHAPLAGGHPAGAPYDVVLLAGAVCEIPPALPRQLADRGRLAGVVRDGAGQRGEGTGKAALLVRAGDTWGRRDLFDAGTPVLPGMARRPGFVF